MGIVTSHLLQHINLNRHCILNSKTLTLNMAGMMQSSVEWKVILRGRVCEGKYEQERICTPDTSRLGLRGRQVLVASILEFSTSSAEVRAFIRSDSFVFFTVSATSNSSYHIICILIYTNTTDKNIFRTINCFNKTILSVYNEDVYPQFIQIS